MPSSALSCRSGFPSTPDSGIGPPEGFCRSSTWAEVSKLPVLEVVTALEPPEAGPAWEGSVATGRRGYPTLRPNG